MRKTKACPKCACKKLVVIDRVAESSDSGVTSLAIRHEGYSFMGNEKLRSVGKLEAVMCSECGYTELYCVDPKAVEPDGKFIRWL